MCEGAIRIKFYDIYPRTTNGWEVIKHLWLITQKSIYILVHTLSHLVCDNALEIDLGTQLISWQKQSYNINVISFLPRATN